MRGREGTEEGPWGRGVAEGASQGLRLVAGRGLLLSVGGDKGGAALTIKF